MSANIYSGESEIVKLFETLFQHADRLLLFTQSVKRIEFYVLREDATVMEHVYNFDVAVEKVMRGHGIELSGCDALQTESSLLRAAVENRLKENVIILKRTYGVPLKHVSFEIKWRNEHTFYLK